jgi:hypothetical protein
MPTSKQNAFGGPGTLRTANEFMDRADRERLLASFGRVPDATRPAEQRYERWYMRGDVRTMR